MPPIEKSTARQEKSTARKRKKNIIAAFEKGMSNDVKRFKKLKEEAEESGSPRSIVTNGDIDGLVSACLLHSVTGWKVKAIVWPNRKISLHPELKIESQEQASKELFVVDLFSPVIPGVSNHGGLWGGKKIAGKNEIKEKFDAFDQKLIDQSEDVMCASPNHWIVIKGSYPNKAEDALSYRYGYRMGTAQVLLAMLEAADLKPKLYDAEYLPWLIANCDGGIGSFSGAPENIPMWWSALATFAGPSSYSQQIYRLVGESPVNRFREIDNALRSEENTDLDGALNGKWNLNHQAGTTNLQLCYTNVRVVTEWIDDISGWGDPFAGEVSGIDKWEVEEPGHVERLISPKDGMHEGIEIHSPQGLQELDRDLDRVLKSISYGYFTLNQTSYMFGLDPWW